LPEAIDDPVLVLQEQDATVVVLSDTSDRDGTRLSSTFARAASMAFASSTASEPHSERIERTNGFEEGSTRSSTWEKKQTPG
jgi:hypothetical protein